MKVIVGRIIARHMPWFHEHFQDIPTKHIVHDYTPESSEQSLLVNLGVFSENQSTTQGTIGIYEHMQQYVPSVDTQPYTTVLYGDGLSCERGNDAQNARSNGLDKWEGLEGLEPAAQEFHKEMLLLQDYYDVFFKGTSTADRGALSHLRNIFNFRDVKQDTSNNFRHAWELMCLTTEGYVCLFTQKMLDMNDNDSKPPNAPVDIVTADVDDRQRYFDEMCCAVVDKVWHPLDLDAISSREDTIPPVYCCGEELDELVISCDAGLAYASGKYFHIPCTDVDPENIPETWFCSDECREIRQMSQVYCHCRRILHEPMIGCSAGNSCLGYEWYHQRCVDIQDNQVPAGDWFCQDQCRVIAQGRRRARLSWEARCASQDLHVTRGIFFLSKKKCSSILEQGGKKFSSSSLNILVWPGC